MNVDRYHRPGLQPGSLAISLIVTGAMIAGVAFSAPELMGPQPEGRTEIFDVPLPPDPPLDPPKPVPDKPQPLQRTTITAPHPEVEFTLPDALPASDPLSTLPDSAGIAPIGQPVGDPVPIAPPPALPALVGAIVDPRFLDALQPPYPASERRAEHEGRAVVKVLIGPDGRVKQVERVSADSDAFFDATQRQALTRWRFKPATRGGVPVESWKTMNVHFVLEDG